MEQDPNESVISEEEFRQLIAKMFNCTGEVKLSRFFSNFKYQFRDVVREIQDLGAQYTVGDIKTREVIFQSTLDDNFGVLEYGWTDRGVNYGQNFESINFGDRSFLAYMDKGLCDVRPKAAYKYIVAHEFAHVLTSSTRNVNEAISAKYWKEIDPMWQQYCQNVTIWKQYRDDARYDVSDLEPFSMYSCTDIDEFHAEAFTSYRWSYCPSDVVKQVGSIIDKYFKKSRG